ncbi:hypothetical protein CSKR_106688 [Clonorchis sinensis]|uniref:Uncharacterized protein n=1 Tax=Clonorchis sinensis TaxID=79923 RepID=A0A3R7D704_CLOSI|nr:hypothetical protein CSKR_106688 [Clonorchis sinensis]
MEWSTAAQKSNETKRNAKRHRKGCGFLLRPQTPEFIRSAGTVYPPKSASRNTSIIVAYLRRKADLREEVLLTCLISSIHRYTSTSVKFLALVY